MASLSSLKVTGHIVSF